MLAISSMGATPTAIFYIVAVVLFVVAGIGATFGKEGLNFIGLGLAAAFFVSAWNALAAV
ncbi:MAG: hypothetical protein R6X23_11520 [Acidimicrobiia bacterium]